MANECNSGARVGRGGGRARRTKHELLLQRLRWLIEGEVDAARREYAAASKWPLSAREYRHDGDAYLRSAIRIARAAELLEQYPDLLFFEAWKDESVRLYMERREADRQKVAASQDGELKVAS